MLTWVFNCALKNKGIRDSGEYCLKLQKIEGMIPKIFSKQTTEIFHKMCDLQDARFQFIFPSPLCCVTILNQPQRQN